MNKFPIKNTLLMPISPKVLARISSSEQRFIFRRTMPRQPFSRIILFKCQKSPRVIMEVLPGHIYQHPIEEFKRHFFRHSCMQPPEWKAYWFEAVRGIAIAVQSFVVIPEEKRYNPVDFFKLKQAPQNYCYVQGVAWPLGHPRFPQDIPEDCFL